MDKMTDYQFRVDFAVRDYELDFQGVVNNSVYQNYLEHARHEFLKTSGIDVVAMSARGIDLVLTHIDIDYLFPLRSGDRFWVGVTPMRESRLRFAFHQAIHREDGKRILRAKAVGTGVNRRGRPEIPEEILRLLPAG